MGKIYQIIGGLIAVLTLLSTVLGVYYSYFHESDAELIFEGLPTELHEYDNTINSEFSFFLYNFGGATSFIDYVYIDYPSEIVPKQSFAIGSGDTQEVLVGLTAPNEDVNETFVIEVWYDDTMIRSNKINVRWGL